MEGFLAQVAGQLYRRTGDEISSLCLIFPSRRAQLFFNDALSRLCDRPLWEPSITSVDELMSRISGQRAGDRTRLVTELYKVWARHHKEDFDSFYYWGDALLTDFDAIDKYRVDAASLFRNMREMKEIEAVQDFLDPDQLKAIQQFWTGFGPRERDSDEKRAFLKVWDSLGDVYKEYKEALAAEGLAYTGMMHRTAAERLQAGEVPEGIASQRYAVVGFNALTGCEKVLLDYLRDSGVAEFFWDYDDHYIENKGHEAGLFMRENIVRYPMTEPLPGGTASFAGKKEVVAVSAPSDVLQCKYAGTFLAEIAAPGKETAVVLADEGLLETLLWSVPQNVEQINVTMGYPLRQTLAYSFAERLLELQRNKRVDAEGTRFYHSDATGLLRHPYVLEQADTAKILKRITENSLVYPDVSVFAEGEFLTELFTPREGWRPLGEYLVGMLSRVSRGPGAEGDPLRAEFLSVTADGIRKMCNSLEECGVDLSDRTFASLLRRHLQGVRIPYEGEPLQGLQVMGFLETRALDFENVVILSTGDDLLPGNRASNTSFIPYTLRAAYGLPTVQHQEAMYAYYFYRLMQRPGRIHLVYCSRSDERLRGEPSRYIYQLEYESGHRVERREVALDANIFNREPITVEKSESVMRKLNAFLEPDWKMGGRRLSPTAFSAYVACPLRFYFRSVAGIATREEVAEQVDARLFGTILHKAMQYIYAPLKGVADPAVKELINSATVDEAVRRAIAEEYTRTEGEAEYGGGLQLASDVIRRYVNREILPYDAAQSEVRFEELEYKLKGEVAIGAGRTVYFTGTADRVDRLAGDLLRVIDYKTARAGGNSLMLSFDGVESLFTGDARGAAGAAIQTLLYAMMLSQMQHTDVQPAVYAVRHLHEADYSHLLWDKQAEDHVTRYSHYAERFEEQLRLMLTELFDPVRPFVQCEDVRQCKYCDFNAVCARSE